MESGEGAVQTAPNGDEREEADKRASVPPLGRGSLPLSVSKTDETLVKQK